MRSSENKVCATESKKKKTFSSKHEHNCTLYSALWLNVIYVTHHIRQPNSGWPLYICWSENLFLSRWVDFGLNKWQFGLDILVIVKRLAMDDYASFPLYLLTRLSVTSHLVVITMTSTLCSQTILQKSP